MVPEHAGVTCKPEANPGISFGDGSIPCIYIRNKGLDGFNRFDTGVHGAKIGFDHLRRPFLSIGRAIIGHAPKAQENESYPPIVITVARDCASWRNAGKTGS